MENYILQVIKKGKMFAIVYGVATLGKYKSQELADEALKNNKSFFDYWANSASVSYQNRIAEGDFKIINC